MALKNDVESHITQIQSHITPWNPPAGGFAYKEWTLATLKQELTESLSLIKDEVTENASPLLLYEFNQILSQIFSYIPSALSDQGSFNNCVEHTYSVQKLLNQFDYKNSRLDAIIRRSLHERKTAAEAFKNTQKIFLEIKEMKASALLEREKIEVFYARCFSEESESIENKIDSIEDKILKLVSAEGELEKIKVAHNESQKLKDSIEEYHSELLLGTDTEDSLKTEINELVGDISKRKKSIEVFVNEYIIGYSIKSSDTSGVETEQKVISKKQKIDDLHDSFSKFISDEKNDIVDYKSKFTDYETKKKIDIESLLKSATNASLASSFENLKIKIGEKRELAEKAFYLGLLLIVAGILLPYLNYLEMLLFKPDQIYLNLLKRISITAPFIWFAVHQSIKISQYFRLEQEYAHKEVVSRSFEGYKAQVQDLYKERDGSFDLLEKLLSSAITTISKNPSNVLDKIKIHHFPSGAIVDAVAENIGTVAQKFSKKIAD